MEDPKQYYSKLKRMTKKQVVNLCGYKNIKAAYRELGDSHKELSKKKLARMLAF
mgnify:CR=1 FL=1